MGCSGVQCFAEFPCDFLLAYVLLLRLQLSSSRVESGLGARHLRAIWRMMTAQCGHDNGSYSLGIIVAGSLLGCWLTSRFDECLFYSCFLGGPLGIAVLTAFFCALVP